MILLALDLSSKSTGVAIFKNGKLTYHTQIKPDKKLDIDFRLHHVVKEVSKLYSKVDKIVVEDTHFSKSVDVLKDLNKIAGGIIFTWIDVKKTKVSFIQPNVARPLVGLKANTSKAGIQMFVIEKYKLVSKSKIIEYKKKIQSITNAMEKDDQNLKLKKKQFKFGSKSYKKIITMSKQLKNKKKYQLDKLSREIEDTLGIGNDACDSIITGLAYLKKGK